jgi:cytochrome oxidase assembly protein ShyY1
MFRFLLRPKWVAFHLLVAIAVVGMLFLSRWQWQRHNERKAFNDSVATQQAKAPTELSTLLANSTDDQLPWRTVTATVTYLAVPQFEVVNRSQGGRPGRNVVNAARLADGTIVLVNRGFVAAGQPIEPPPDGQVQLRGTVRASERRRFGQTADDGTQQLVQIRRIDVDVLQSQFDEPLAAVYLDVSTSLPADSDLLEPSTAPSLTAGPHLSYTVQWACFSAAAAAGWVLAVRHSVRKRRRTTS